MVDISIHSEAEAEYETALVWYLARSARAAAGFEEAFERALESIAANPQLHPCTMGVIGFACCDGILTASSTEWTATKFAL